MYARDCRVSGNQDIKFVYSRCFKMVTYWSGSTRQSLSLCAASLPSDEEMDKLMSLTNCFLHELVELVYQYRVNEEVFDSKGTESHFVLLLKVYLA